MGRYFTMAEMARSETADRMGIANRIPKGIVPDVEALIGKVLDPLREWYGKPVYVNSGYRCPELNAAVGGSGTSQHMSGQAADIDSGDRTGNRMLFERIRDSLPFDQLIWEHGGDWVHVSYRKDGKNRRQVIGL